MKRVWLNTPDSSLEFKYTIDSSNNALTINEASSQKDYVLSDGVYGVYKLIEELNIKGVKAGVGEYKGDKNKKFVVLYCEDSFSSASGNFIDYLGGIESVDSGDRINVTVVNTGE